MKYTVLVIVLLSLGALACRITIQPSPAKALEAANTPVPQVPTVIPTHHLDNPVRGQVLGDNVYIHHADGTLTVITRGKWVRVLVQDGDWLVLDDGSRIWRGCVSGFNAGVGCR